MAESNPSVARSLSDSSDTPEDVATLYSWANLHGAKYRDFSASRAQAREEARQRVEEALAAEKRRQEEEAERKRQEEAQLAARLAAEAAEAARQAEAERLAEIARQAEAERQAVLAAQEAQRQAALQRAWEAPSADTIAAAYSPAFAAGDALTPGHPHGSGFDHPSGYAADPFSREPAREPARDFGRESGRESGLDRFAPVADHSNGASHRRGFSPAAANYPPVYAAAEPFSPYAPAVVVANQPYSNAPAAIQAPPTPAAPYFSSFAAEPPFSEFGEGRYSDSPFSAPVYPPQTDPYPPSPWQTDAREMREQRDPISRPAWLAPELPLPPPPPAPQTQTVRSPSPYAPYSNQPPAYQPPNPTPTPPYAGNPVAPGPIYGVKPEAFYHQGPPPGSNPGQNPSQNPGLNPGPNPGPGPVAPVDDTLLGSRDRIANRWYALKSVFDPQTAPQEQAPAQPPARVPVLAVFSLAGGVGKTSLVASLGRALSSRGERVLLVDTAAYGLLPFFFGARDQRPGMLRTFNPPGVSTEAPIQLVTLDPDGQVPDFHPPVINQDPNQGPSRDLESPPISGANQDWLAQEVSRYSRGANRVLIDLPTASGSTTRRVLRLAPVILVPVAPDMNSMVSVGAIETFFRNNAGQAPAASGKQIMPYYVLNQFDYSLPLHLDVREILREQIGDRLLPFALRRSPAVSEALAEGMTVMDYAPNAVVAEDYANLAGWVRSLSAPATQSYRGVRWSER